MDTVRSTKSSKKGWLIAISLIVVLLIVFVVTCVAIFGGDSTEDSEEDKKNAGAEVKEAIEIAQVLVEEKIPPSKTKTEILHELKDAKEKASSILSTDKTDVSKDTKGEKIVDVEISQETGGKYHSMPVYGSPKEDIKKRGYDSYQGPIKREKKEYDNEEIDDEFSGDTERKTKSMIDYASPKEEIKKRRYDSYQGPPAVTVKVNRKITKPVEPTSDESDAEDYFQTAQYVPEVTEKTNSLRASEPVVVSTEGATEAPVDLPTEPEAEAATPTVTGGATEDAVEAAGTEKTETKTT